MKLSDLPIGTQVKDSKAELLFVVADIKKDAITLLSEKIDAVSCFDGAEPDHAGHKIWDGYATFGNNNYFASNIHQWLNSDKEDWYQPTHKYDTPPSVEYLRYGEQPTDTRPGYMTQFSDFFKDTVLDTEVTVLERVKLNEGKLVTGTAKFYLPSRTEICKGDESGYAEGSPLQICYDPLYVHHILPTDSQLAIHGRSWNPAHEGAPLDAPQIYDPKFGWWYGLRSPNLQYGFLVRAMTTYGALSYTYANNDVLGVRPLCRFSPDTPVKVALPFRKAEHGFADAIYMIAPE